MRIVNTLILTVALTGPGLLLPGCSGDRGPAQDEARQAGKTTADFPQAEADYFKEMDGGIELTADEVKGRNTWMIWTGGNEAFWDYLANNSFGTFDLLKVVSSYPCAPEQKARRDAYVAQYKGKGRDYRENGYGFQSGYGDGSQEGDAYQPYYIHYQRDQRFAYLGLMNEPGFRAPTKPDQHGLCIDERTAPPEPFDQEVYGRPSGILGLRIYDNPAFDAAAAKHWDSDRYFNDPDYYYDPELVRPYRVGMACSFCHVSHHPLFPPADPEHPEMRNLSATIGAQYFWFGRIFAPNVTPDNLVWHILESQQPGAVDTSLLPHDYINNPRAMNAIFNLPARLAAGERFHQEEMAGGTLDLPQVATHKEDGYRFGVPHILWDGSDSVGVDAALTRVYINIGEYHQEWLRHVRPLIGGRPQTPIEVRVAQENSVFWNATQERSGDLAKYLVRASAPMDLKDAPGGEAHLHGERGDDEYQALLKRGKLAFADNCARCHSSKLPKPAPGLDDGIQCSGKAFRKCWDRFWTWSGTDEFKEKMREIVLADGFLDDNYLATGARIPVDLLETEVCSSMASNALAGHVWDNFSSKSYKELPDIGEVTLKNPISGEAFEWYAQGGGRGYQRVPSLVWSTAPFLHNNEIGLFNSDPSTKGRMEAFDDAIHKLLWPETRGETIHVVDRDDVYLKVSTEYLPEILQPLVDENWFANILRRFLGLGWLVGEGMVQIGPIPKGTPVNLLANVNLDVSDPAVKVPRLVKLLIKVKHRLKEVHNKGLSDAETTAVLRELVPDLLKVSACPDFVVNRGHNFGANLGDADKQALIEIIKTF
jgi:hypothetical protein